MSHMGSALCLPISLQGELSWENQYHMFIFIYGERKTRLLMLAMNKVVSDRSKEG